jgi:hypothetical protein
MLRDLIDRVNEKLLVFMNFTLSENEEDTVRLLMGDALWQRVNEKIRFSNLSEEECNTFIIDSIKIARKDKKLGIAPFTEESISLLVASLPSINRVPRELNRQMNSLLRYSMKNEFSEIDKNVVNQWISKSIKS